MSNCSVFSCRMVLSFLLAAHNILHGQVIPSFGQVYNQTEVTSIYITINPDSLNTMMENLDNQHEYPADFIFQSSTLADTVGGIGFRLRGNTSLDAAKKSFKISFNTFDTGAKWQNLEKMNLLATVNDPSLIRNKLSHDLFRSRGIPAARISYTRLYINNEYRGLYQNVEHIDEQMSAVYFDGQGDGNLYKCTYPADLTFISNNAEDYKFALWGERHYDLKTNTYLDDYSDLSEFIAALNANSSSDAICIIPKYIDVYSYIKVAAADVLIGNWDGYILNKNNFYLYHNQISDRFNYLPYDLDNTWGIDWIGQDWAERNIYTWSQANEDRPLYELIMNEPEYRARFSHEIESICNSYLHPDSLFERITYWQNLIAPHVAEDPYYALDFGYTPEVFSDAASLGCCNHVPYGIMEYAQIRRAAAIEQLEPTNNETYAVHWIMQRTDTNAVHIRAKISGTPTAVLANYSWDGITYNSGSMNDADSDGIWEFLGPLFNTGSDKLFYRIVINGIALFPCEPQFHWITRSDLPIRINEVCATNNSLITDDFAEFDDWIELYNNSDQAYSLSGCFLSDDLSNWNRWELPDTVIEAHGFMLLWLDDDLEQGRKHANFKLNAAEPLICYRREELRPRLIDRAQNFSPVSDATWALTTDGGSTSWITVTQQTPGFSNNTLYMSEPDAAPVRVYPNPASDFIHISGFEKASVYDAFGRLCYTGILPGRHDVSDLADGVYFIRNTTQVIPFVINHSR